LRKVFEAETEKFISESEVMYIVKPRLEKKGNSLYHRLDVSVDNVYEYVILPITERDAIKETLHFIECEIKMYIDMKEKTEKLCKEWVFASEPPFED